jgi:catechol 2,3-dioxygenase-like lactoylglutathione lyase family enzyme
MPTAFDHTIVPSRDMETSAKFYEEILGFDDIGEDPEEGLRGLRINSAGILFLEKSTDSDSSPWSQGTHHYAFSLDRKKFDQVLSNLKAKGIRFGDSYKNPENMKAAGRKARGAKGKGRSIYFRDPSDNLLQIITY